MSRDIDDVREIQRLTEELEGVRNCYKIECANHKASIKRISILQEQLADVWRLRKALADLTETLNNGIQYDEERNMLYLVWTEKQIADAKARAEKLSKLFFEHEATKPTEQPK